MSVATNEQLVTKDYLDIKTSEIRKEISDKISDLRAELLKFMFTQTVVIVGLIVAIIKLMEN